MVKVKTQKISKTEDVTLSTAAKVDLLILTNNTRIGKNKFLTAKDVKKLLKDLLNTK